MDRCPADRRRGRRRGRGPEAGAPRDAALPPQDGPPPPAVWSFFAAGDSRSQPDIFRQNVRSMWVLDPAALALFNGGAT